MWNFDATKEIDALDAEERALALAGKERERPKIEEPNLRNAPDRDENGKFIVRDYSNLSPTEFARAINEKYGVR